MDNQGLGLVYVGILVFALFYSIFSGGGADDSETLDSWVGSHQSELIAVNGPPTTTTDDGDGGRILIYETTQTHHRLQTPGRVYVSPYGGSATYTEAENNDYTTTTRVMFYVHSNGMIYHWLVK